MKKTILAILTAFVLVSCQKELSYEQTCGIITDRNPFTHDITVSYSGTLVTHHIGLLFFHEYEVGDTYCK